VVELVEVAAHLGDPGQVHRPLRDDGAGSRVAEDPGDLLGGGRLVDGDGDGTREPDRIVDEGPLVAGLGDQADPVTDLDAGGDQALGDGPDLVVELPRRDVSPLSVDAAAEDHVGAGVAGVDDHVVGEVPRGGNLGRQGRGVLTHGSSWGRRRGPVRERTRAHAAGYR